MVSLSVSSSLSSLHSVPSPHSLLTHGLPPSPSSHSLLSAGGSASSSSLSLNTEDEENITITANNRLSLKNGRRKSQEDLHVLAVSTRITELSYSISDIQTRIFEIQELRHKSQSGDASSATGVIDQSLANLDERLESVSQGVKGVKESLGPLLEASRTPTLAQGDSDDENTMILRKHATMLAEWESVQKESQVLREELKEDKWLTVFRTVTEQADGMMSSLEKAVNRCQDFIYQVQRRGADDALMPSSSKGSIRSEKSPLSIDVYNSLLESFEAKKKHYMPATTKVLSIIDKGVQDRVTKNGECLRRHAESTQRWRNLKERIGRTDTEMDGVRRLLLAYETTPSETGSSASANTSMSRNGGYLATPQSAARSAKNRAPSSSSTISRSISPFRKLARKLKNSTRSPDVATPVPLSKAPSRTPSSEPAPKLRHRTSLFNLLGGQPSTPKTPDRPSHKYTQSLTPDSSPSRNQGKDSISLNATLKSSRPAWNSSTRVEDEERQQQQTLKGQSPRRTSAMGFYRDEQPPPVPPLGAQYKRSLSRSSMASSRPWSPVTSSNSTAQSSSNNALPMSSLFRPPSRAHTPGPPVSARTRPKTPSHIPAPVKLSHWRSVSASPADGRGGGGGGEGGMMSLMQRAFSPAMSSPRRSETPSGHPPRPPSRSMIPVPSVQISSPSRPPSAASLYRPESSMSFRTRAQTPDGFFQQLQRVAPRVSTTTTTPNHRLPPSSFKDSHSPATPTPRTSSGSRPPSRSGAATPSHGLSLEGGRPVHVYVPASAKDPLDVELAAVANGIGHGLLIERVDPPLRAAPREGEEIRAQYAFSNVLARKVVTCKLTTMTRGSAGKGRETTTTRKVMCRVGGGWQDLQMYLVNRQAGM